MRYWQIRYRYHLIWKLTRIQTSATAFCTNPFRSGNVSDSYTWSRNFGFLVFLCHGLHRKGQYLVLEEELPMAPLGPLRECRCPCALQPSSCTRASLHLGWSCHCCSVASVVALENAHCSSIFYVVWYLIPAFHYSVREKCLLASSLAACGRRLSGQSVLLVALADWEAIWNQVSRSTLSNPLTILKVWIISAWCRLSSSVVRPNSKSFWFYSFPFSPETMAMALLWIFSNTSLSASAHGDQADDANSRCGLTYCT